MFKSVNPYNQEVIATFDHQSEDQVRQILNSANTTFTKWRTTPFAARAEFLKKVSVEIRDNQVRYAETITREMGKPILQARAELEKSAWVCEFYADHAEAFLREDIVETDASKSWVSYEPLGVILAIMPWNYPFWQVMRFLAPAVMAGYT